MNELEFLQSKGVEMKTQIPIYELRDWEAVGKEAAGPFSSSTVFARKSDLKALGADDWRELSAICEGV